MIKKYKCLVHKIVTSRKGLRKHIGQEHARNKFKNSEVDSKGNGGVWTREVFE